MPNPPPVTEAERDRVAELHAAGASRNEIARQLGRSVSTITRLAGELGLSFDRTATAAATAAAKADAAGKRAALALALLDDADRLRRQLWEPCTIHAFGGRDNVYNSKRVKQPPFRDQRVIVQSTAAAITASLRLDERDSDNGSAAAGAMLTNLADRLGAAWRANQQGEAAEPPADD